MLLQHANNDSGPFSNDIATILSEAAGPSPKRQLWISTILFGELRPSLLAQGGRFKTIDELVAYIRGIATVVAPDPGIMLHAARLRDLRWFRQKPTANEKPRAMTLGDAVHIASALMVKSAYGVSDLEFLTFDNSSKKSTEADPDTKVLPLLSAEDYMRDLGTNSEALDVIRLPRLRPIIRQSQLV